MIKEFSLKGKVVIVTGGSRGIGKAITETMEEDGAKVIAVSKSGGCDITDEKQIINMVKNVISDFGKIDVLVNCAGILIMKPLFLGFSDILPEFSEPFTEDEWQRQVDVNMRGTYYCTKHIAERMAKQKSGKIINISSIDAIKGMPFHAAYSMTKGAIISLTRNLAVELGRFNINVNCICPGFVRTDMTEFAHKNEKMRTSMVNMSPLRKLTEKRDIALLVAFLASGASDAITGQVICADCGVVC